MHRTAMYVEIVHAAAGDRALPVTHIFLDDDVPQPVSEALAEMAGALSAHYSLIVRRIVRDFRAH